MLTISGDASRRSSIDNANQLFSQLSISLDSKFHGHKHITSKPKLKRLIKVKSPGCTSINSNTTFCSRCKKETLIDNTHNGRTGASEKEVDFKKENSWQKKVHFNSDCIPQRESDHERKADWLNLEESIEKKNVALDFVTGENHNEAIIFESVPPKLHPSSTFASRPSIIGDNEFWLPQFFAANQASQDNDAKNVVSQNSSPTDAAALTPTQNPCNNKVALTEFLNGIFKQTEVKRQLRILHVETMLNETLLALTSEHLFNCRPVGRSFDIVDVMPLKSIQRIMVSEIGIRSCSLIILEISHASSLTELKEFVPGYFEKTESLISLMVYALSRINKVLPDVTRIPFLALPTCKTIQSWLLNRDEQITFIGIAAAEHLPTLSHHLSNENYMMRTAQLNQFHPVVVSITEGCVTTECNGGCGDCRYSMAVNLIDNKATLVRENNPWPNCVHIISDLTEISLAGSSESCADELLEKLYEAQHEAVQYKSLKRHAYVIITEYSMQLFSSNTEKEALFGSPLLNLEITDQELKESSCIIEFQGGEADDAEIVQLQNRWLLTFQSSEDKLKFLQFINVNAV